MWSISTITPSSFDVVAVDDLHAYLRLNDTSEDALLSAFIAAAEDIFVNQTGYVLGQTTYQLNLDMFPVIYPLNSFLYSSAMYGFFPTAHIYLPRTPVQSVTSVMYLDSGGNWDSLTGWTTDLNSTPARIILPLTLPLTHPYQRPAVKVQFVAGFSELSLVPAGPIVAVKLLASHWWKNRDAYGDSMTELPMGFLALTKRYSMEMLDLWNVPHDHQNLLGGYH